MQRLICAFCAILVALNAHAQPQVQLLRQYDNGDPFREIFLDVFACTDGGYYLVGASQASTCWAMKIDEEGDELWSIELGRIQLTSVIQADNGDAVIGGRLNDSLGVYRINSDGEVVWRQTYATGHCRTVIELKNGDFLAAGFHGHVVRFDGEGRVVWMEQFRPEEGYSWTIESIRETGGNVIAAGYERARDGSQVKGWLVKFDQNGDQLLSRLFDGDYEYSEYWKIVSTPNGFAIGGRLRVDERHQSEFGLIKVNTDGEVEWSRSYMVGSYASGIARLEDGGFCLVGYHSDENFLFHPIALRTSSEGDSMWTNNFHQWVERAPGRAWDNQLRDVITVNGSQLVACGSLRNVDDQRGSDGLLVRFEPDILGPQFITRSPEDTILNVLPDTTIEFSVIAVNIYGWPIDYAWFFNDSLVGVDSLTELRFNELGEFTVVCGVTVRDWSIQTEWLVIVQELFISSHQPDTLELTVRRNESVDFSVEVEAVEGGPVNYEWTFGGEVISNEPSTNVNFPESGDHPVHIVASREEAADSLQWLVHVRSTVRDFWPDELQFRAPVDTTILFGVEPFDPGEMSMSMIMSMNGDTVAVDTSEVWVRFEEVGEYDIRYIVRIGEEADTIRWEVTIYDPLGVDRQAGTPAPLGFGLLPPSPNPFNSSVALSFALPQPSHIRLVVFDISGRVVQEIADGRYGHGGHSVIWNAGGVPAGIYFARLEAGGRVFTRKLALVR